MEDAGSNTCMGTARAMSNMHVYGASGCCGVVQSQGTAYYIGVVTAGCNIVACLCPTYDSIVDGLVALSTGVLLSFLTGFG